MCSLQIMRLVLCFYLITPYTVRNSKLVLLLLSVPAGKGHTRGPDLPAHSACCVPLLTSRQFLAPYETLKVQNRVHNSPLFVRILSHMTPVHTFQSYFIKIHFNIVLTRTPNSYKWSVSFPHTCHVPCPSNL